MRVLHLGKFCPPREGGIEIFTFDLLEYLNRKGVSAELLCFDSKCGCAFYNSFKYYSSRVNMIINSAPLSYDFVHIFVKIHKSFDIIHIHAPNPLAEVLSLISKRKIVIHWHSDIVKQKFSYFVYKHIQRKVLKNADKIICTSPQYLESSYQLDHVKPKVTVIPLGLDPERLLSIKKDSRFAEFIGKVKNRKVILSIGRLVKYKGFEYLIEAGKYIYDNGIIVIIGDGPMRNFLKKKIENLKLEDKVILFGKVDSVSEYIKNCDLFVLPSISRNEAFGLVLVEALYFGKPLITTDVNGSGMNYVNQNNITGLVVPPKNSKALAYAVNKILSNRSLYNFFSENAKRRFDEFKIDVVGNKILRLYEEIVS